MSVLKFKASNILMGVEERAFKKANYHDLGQSRAFVVAFFDDLTCSVQHSIPAQCIAMA